MAKIRKFKVDETELKSSAAKIGEGAKKERESGTASMMSDLSKRPEKKAAPKASAPAKSSSFGSAFASARKSGAKTFTWNGKSYTTQMAGEKKSAPKASAPAKTESAKSYVPKGGTKAPPPVMAGKSTPTMLAKSKPKGSDYRGPVKTGSEKPVSWAGSKPAGFMGLKSASPSKTYKPGVEDVKARDTFTDRKVKLSPEKERRLREAKDRAAQYQKQAAATIARNSSMSELDKVRAKFRERGQTPTFAKGGSIDGIAKRGKTRAGRK